MRVKHFFQTKLASAFFEEITVSRLINLRLSTIVVRVKSDYYIKIILNI